MKQMAYQKTFLLLVILGLCFQSIEGFKILQKQFQVFPYNLTESKILAKYVSVSFCDGQCVSDWNCHVSKQIPLMDPTHLSDNLTLTAGYIGYRPDVKAIILAMRGSQNKRNWWQNFNFQLIPFTKCKDCNVHAGFYFDFLHMENRVFSLIDKLASKHEVKKIISSGHSLGAAISIIAGLEIKLKYGTKYEVEVHNFGQPRIGDSNLAQFMKNKLNGIFRVVHNKDLVPHVPFEFLKYAHPPNEIFFSEDMKTFKICNDSGEDPSCSNQFYPNYDPNDHDFYFMHIDNAANCKVSTKK